MRDICTHQNHQEAYHYGASTLSQCNDCALIYISKAEYDPKTLYKDFYRNELGRFNFGIEYLIRAFRLFRAFKIFTLYPQAKSVLDIGCGRGFTLYYLKKFFQFSIAVGTQISESALAICRRLGLKVYEGDLLELSIDEHGFDVISILHVLEHVTRPEKYIEKIHDLLSDRGKLVIEVPNFDSWTRPLTGKFWLGLDLKYHLSFFTPKSLCRMLTKHGFKIKIVRTFSLEYSTFISAQSITSLITRSDQFFFQQIQNVKQKPLIFFHAFLIFLLAPICFLINGLLYFSKKGEVLLIVAEK